MTLNIVHSMSKDLRFDTKYHIILSVAIMIKGVFLICAIVSFYETKRGNETSPFTKKMIKLKDITNELFKLIICGLMIVIFYPRNQKYCIDKPMKILLFSYAIISLMEIKWSVAINTHPFFRNLQYFFGRNGSLSDQITRDKHISTY